MDSTAFNHTQAALRAAPRRWLVTGAAGFIGSNLIEMLLKLDQRVVGLDNFSTGRRRNLEEVQSTVSPEQWSRFQFLQGDIADQRTCRLACEGAEIVLHQAALGSVPASIADPVGAHGSNVSGFLHMLAAARDAGLKRFVYASSSAVYGDDPELPKVEEKIGKPLSPYAANKLINEIYADVFARAYGFETIGLRYFNVFGPRQDPAGAYAAVIPKWVAAMLKGEPIYINGDGETTRDFCYVDNIVQANILAGTVGAREAVNQVFNIALGGRTTLNELLRVLQTAVRRLQPELPEIKPVYREFRPGDVRHSVADVSKARRLLGFTPVCSVTDGLTRAMDWYFKDLKHP